MKIETSVDLPPGRTLGVVIAAVTVIAVIGLANYEEEAPAPAPAPTATVSPSPSAS